MYIYVDKNTEIGQLLDSKLRDWCWQKRHGEDIVSYTVWVKKVAT